MDNLYEQTASPEPQGPSTGIKPKRRRLHGSCDVCRKKKIKCDSAQMPDNICTNCIAFGVQCSHNTPRHPKKDSQKGYIRLLEQRLDKMEQMLRSTIGPDGADSGPISASSPESVAGGESHDCASPSFTDVKYPIRLMTDTQSVDTSTHSGGSSEDEDLAHVSLSEHFGHLSIDPIGRRFFGQSSAFMFVQHASSMKTKYTGTQTVENFRRPSYWNIRPWERLSADAHTPNYVYPDPDLIESLVSLYFSHIHILTPILHRPSFEKSVREGLHLYDRGFGMILLMVCATASRYSMDPRIFSDDDDSGISCGWKYFSQIPTIRNFLVYQATLYDLQYYCLATAYLLGTSVPQGAWSLLSIGIRLAQERGVHRRKGGTHKITAEDELMRRAFWCLLLTDRVMSSFLGRPCAIQDEDFDIEFPAECDDEYWEFDGPYVSFNQPKGKPCLMAGFNFHLKLCDIFSFTMRTLYSTKKSKVLSGLIGDQWEQRIVAELDSAMNKWIDSLPEYLRWETVQKGTPFFHQSVSLYSSYHYLQIQIHRPFLQKNSPLSFASHTICAHAARSCSHILQVAGEVGLRPFPNIFMSAFASGIVLLLNLWGRRNANQGDVQRTMADVNKCLSILKECEKRWHSAGRLWDLLNEMSSMKDNHMPAITSNATSAQAQEYSAARQLQPTVAHNAFPRQPNTAREALVHPKTPFDFQAVSNSANFSAGSDWDLSNLLLAQMGYMQSNTTPATAPPIRNSPPSAPSQQEHGYYFSAIPIDTTFPARTTTSQDVPVADESMMSLWMGAPAAGYDMDEWDMYITNMGGTVNNAFGSGSLEMMNTQGR
ncbi:fungal-specific transcription factor domain-containing protein [Crucibulum laeve]|uniref:Fungal-specific transcription factor domain-containing protein n=1 Tax=Crucibulum laeve TaxID=68775 RepID=A0A5C3MG84_9AGAR|nr:fungal-specific transcription factor domain-containing protein [Crucibulum laeve]